MYSFLRFFCCACCWIKFKAFCKAMFILQMYIDVIETIVLLLDNGIKILVKQWLDLSSEGT